MPVRRTQIQMGEVLRYPRVRDPQTELIGEHRNFFWVTSASHATAVQMEKGIDAPAQVAAPEGSRLPVVLTRSSPHRLGSPGTPWQDHYDVDNGHIRYFGDNKVPGRAPEQAPGNAVLRNVWSGHQAPTQEERAKACPIVAFRSVPHERRQKGFVRFEGVCLARACELVTQFGADGYFANFAWDLVVISVAEEDELFDWAWIDARRDPEISVEDTLRLAPRSWRTWVEDGETSISRVRRYVARRSLVGRDAQRPASGTPPARLLREVYDTYQGRQAEFEAVAAWMADRILGQAGTYTHHGVTRATGDRGFDFVGRLDLGSGFGSVKLVVLGQAKCENLDTPTGATHVARTVARLRRGWVGVYVTTSYFSRSTQFEVIQDRYPVLLVNGLDVATALAEELHRRGRPPLSEVLDDIQATFGGLTELSDPDQVLFPS
jgi:hypothetical protein